jgi:putative methionine-R-sulfoxide reductase with GAF domain
MLVSTRLRIPEMEAFDQDEIELNPVLNLHESVPLFGALLVAEGTITLEQLNACLLLQTQDYPNTPIGQILLRCGYIQEGAIEQTLKLQNELKVLLLDRIETDNPIRIQTDMSALMLHRHADASIGTTLRKLGVATTQVRDWAEFQAAWQSLQPDLILIDAELIENVAGFPEQATTPIFFLPPISRQYNQSCHLFHWLEALLVRFVQQARVERQQHDALVRLSQLEFEISAAAAMSRSMSTACSPHDALVHLMSTIRDLFDIEAGTLYLFDHATQQLIFEVVLGPHQDTLSRQRLSIDRGIAGWVVRHGEPLLIPNVRRDRRFEGMFDHQNGFQTRSILCVPMIAMGEVRGVIQLINKLNGDFNERDLLLMRILAAMGALAEAAVSQRAVSETFR